MRKHPVITVDGTAASGKGTLARLLADLKQQDPTLFGGLDTLSMGMSADLEAAVLEGATMVRIGSAIFGAPAPRPRTCCWRWREDTLTVGELEPTFPPTVPKEDSPTGLLDTPEGT